MRSFYHVLTPRPGASFPWKAKCPSRIAVFSWTAAWGNILTSDNLRKRGLPVVSRCYLCMQAAESVDHLLLHCDWAWHMWTTVFRLFEVQWVMPRTVSDLLSCWLDGVGQRSELWRIVPHCVMWTLWRERNARLFENVEQPLQRLCTGMFRYLLDWAVGAGVTHFTCISDILASCVM